VRRAGLIGVALALLLGATACSRGPLAISPAATISSTRTPHTTPVIRKRDGFIFGACAKKSSKLALFANSASSEAWPWPVSQRKISSTSARVRPFFSALAI
jgi:hypothetical protein